MTASVCEGAWLGPGGQPMLAIDEPFAQHVRVQAVRQRDCSDRHARPQALLNHRRTELRAVLPLPTAAL